MNRNWIEPHNNRDVTFVEHGDAIAAFVVMPSSEKPLAYAMSYQKAASRQAAYRYVLEWAQWITEPGL